MHRLSEVSEDGMFGHVLGPGLEYQIKVVENTVTTDAKGREGGDFGRVVIMTLSVQCGIWRAPLTLRFVLKITLKCMHKSIFRKNRNTSIIYYKVSDREPKLAQVSERGDDQLLGLLAWLVPVKKSTHEVI